MQATIRELRSFLDWYKRSSPCADCGGCFDVSCMDLDHVPERGPKGGNIVEFIKGKLRGTMEDLWRELAKCDVVCSNCHRLRTKRRGVPQLARERLSSSVRKSAKKRINRWGKAYSPETLAKMSASAKGRKLSEETKLKISAAHTGRKKSAETRLRMAAAQQAARSQKVR